MTFNGFQKWIPIPPLCIEIEEKFDYSKTG